MPTKPKPTPDQQRIPVCQPGWHAKQKEQFYFLNNQNDECVVSIWPGSFYPFTEEEIKVPPHHAGNDGKQLCTVRDDLPDGTYQYQVTGCGGSPLMMSSQESRRKQTLGVPKEVTIP